jgi:transcriptional regulator GlxA family with amidase domain
MSAEFTVVFALFPRVTQLDFTGPYEVFIRLPGARVILASSAGGEIQADGGMTFANVVRLADVARCDLLCVPGGFGTAQAMGDADLLAQLRRLAAGARYVTSVCTGSLVLGAAGLLRGLTATTHWSCYPLLEAHGARPTTERVVEHLGHRVITSAGVSSGIDMALRLVELLVDRTAAQAAQLMIEYDPQPPFDSGSLAKSSAPVRERVAEYARHRQ